METFTDKTDQIIKALNCFDQANLQGFLVSGLLKNQTGYVTILMA